MDFAFDPRKRYSDREIMELSRLYPLRFERNAAGRLIVAPPTGMDTGEQNLSLEGQLWEWNRRYGLGKAYNASTGFRLPDGSMLSPDASWVERSRWEALRKEERAKFAPLCPDVVFELASPTDRPGVLRKKMLAYLRNGAKLGVLILVRKKVVELYRPQGVTSFPNPRTLELGPELPGFKVNFSEILG